ncbi:MAG: dioxygenase [Planctomycetes bacterium]|nr:dioxygenase [Planctomycetota bacterium]
MTSSILDLTWDASAIMLLGLYGPSAVVRHAMGRRSQGRPMIRKVSSEGVGYSVADLTQVRYLFVSGAPRDGADFFEQAYGALTAVARVMHEEGARGGIVRQDVFIRDHALIPDCKKIIEEFYCDEMPATDYIVQPPCGGKLLEIEAWGVSRKKGHAEIERVSEHLVVLRHSGVAWAHCAGITPKTHARKVHPRALNAFGLLRDALASKGFDFSQTLRTWLYLGDIVGPEGDTQRYKELNRARSDFYQDISFLKPYLAPSVNAAIYPASTGIGASDRDIMMSAIAIATERTDIRLLPLENPLQVSAFRYGERYGQRSPKFSRAMAILGPEAVAILVSGTASIVDSETRHVGDVEAQTHQTLDNIEALIARSNFQAHGAAAAGAALKDLVLARVYVKRQEDYAKVRAICRARLGELPATFAVADVCRPELLVEIEGIAFAPRG